MIDTDKLKRLAEAISKRPRPSVDYSQYEKYYEAANPSAILSLIAENERLKDTGSILAMKIGECRVENERLSVLVRAFNNGMPPMTNKDVVEQRHGLVALLRAVEYKVSESVVERVSAFLSRIDAKGSE